MAITSTALPRPLVPSSSVRLHPAAPRVPAPVYAAAPAYAAFPSNASAVLGSTLACPAPAGTLPSSTYAAPAPQGGVMLSNVLPARLAKPGPSSGYATLQTLQPAQVAQPAPQAVQPTLCHPDAVPGIPGYVNGVGQWQPDGHVPYVDRGYGYEAFRGFLEVLSRGRFTEALSPDQDGVLRVNVPFCGSFSEAQLFAEFLEANVLTRSDVSAVAVVGADRDTNYINDLWPLWQKFYDGQRLRLELQVQDLAAQPMPPATFTLAVHPRPLASGEGEKPLWDKIIQGVLQSTPNGLVVFVLFIRQECDELIRMCTSMGARCEPVVENPFFVANPQHQSKDSLFKLANVDYIHFFVFAWTGGAGRAS